MSKPIKQRQFFPGQPEAVPPVYVESMTLQEVRCFGEKQTLKFTKPDGSIAQWTVILGENGVGKTTVLQCLAGMQPVKDAQRYGATALSPYIFWPHSPFAVYDWLRPEMKGNELQELVSMEIELALTRTFPSTVANSISLPRWHTLIGRTRRAGTSQMPEEMAALQFYAFGAGRRMGVEGRKAFDARPEAQCDTLFSNECQLNNAEEWLLDLDNLASRVEGSKERRLADKRLSDVLEMLPNVLPMVHEVEFQVDEKPTKRVRIKFRTDYGWLPIESLSYGYQTMISWIVDFTRRMYDRYPDAKDPLAEPAIVLVDEIDLHLHPKWQRELMGFLSKRFPKTQFIVTAHSPLIIQSEEVANVILLQRDPNKPDQVIVRQDDVAEIRKWRLDQILTSDLYGLESATAPEISSKEARRRELIRKAKRTAKEEAELAAIEDELAKLPAFSSREAMQAEQLFKEAAELLADEAKPAAKRTSVKRKK